MGLNGDSEILIAKIPICQDDPDGKFVLMSDPFQIISERGDFFSTQFNSVHKDIGWFKSDDIMFCKWIDIDPCPCDDDCDCAPKEDFRVLRKLTAIDISYMSRMPRWIQGEEVPVCCGSLMLFVGQIDDEQLCSERPQDAQIWWHDIASFYVFTCPFCLGVKAVGQQY